MTSRKLITFFVSITIASCFFFENAFAQEEVYVDAPVGQAAPQGQQAAGAAIGGGGPASTFVDQFNSGLINYGFTDPIYLQFTGNSIFNESSFPDSFFTNVGWNHFVSLDFKYLPAYSFGAELQYYTATSENVYRGESSVVGPSVNMNLFLLSGFVRAYFLDPLREFLHPFFGFGWGVVSGNIDTTKVGGSKYSTAFFGLQSYRAFGMQVKLAERGGLMMELRTITARAATSNDPFDRSDGDSVDLNFSGVQVGLTGYFRF